MFMEVNLLIIGLIFKEAINNAAKYAECTAVYADIDYSMGKVKMVIHDNGKGFDNQLASQGNGLTNMRQRAGQMKGQLTIQSTEGVGTVITLLF